MDSEDKKISRRLFLGGTATVGLSAGVAALMPAPIEKLIEVMTGSFISQARAEEMGLLGSRNYVNLLLFGAPLRFGFDHWMRTNATDPVMEFNQTVATALVQSAGTVTGTQYLTIPYKGLLVPKMFDHQVFNGKGAKRPLKDLLDNMLVIRGYGSGLDGHPFNCTIQQAPLGGSSSIAGLAADYSQKTFQAIQYPNRGTIGNYNSVNGKALNKLAGAKPLNNLLEGFAPPAADRLKARALKQRNQEAIDLARSRMLAYVDSGLPGSKVLASNVSGATDLMKKGVGNIDSYWTEALTRYRNLINASMRETNLSGISDTALEAPPDSPLWKVGALSGAVIQPLGDLRTQLSTCSTPDNLAEGFALAEYVIKQGLATSIEIFTTSLGAINIQDVAGAMATQLVAHDMHNTGAISGTVLTNAFFRGIAAAILELADQLKAVKINGTDLWSETVFQISGDFGRSPRADGTGSDHGYNAMVTSVYSGIIKEPMVVGNIAKGGINSSYAGTQGIGAAIDGYNQPGRPTPVMAASTVAALLRVPKNPFENVAAPLVKVENGQVVAIKKGKMVG